MCSMVMRKIKKKYSPYLETVMIDGDVGSLPYETCTPLVQVFKLFVLNTWRIVGQEYKARGARF